MTFAEKIIFLRRSRGMSQEELAEMLDVSRQTVSKWGSELSLPDAAKLIKLSELFEINVDTLLKDNLDITKTQQTDTSIKKAAPQPQLGVMFCTQCGKENRADSKFCGYCGHPFTSFMSASGPNETLTKDDVEIAYYKAHLNMQQQSLLMQQQTLSMQQKELNELKKSTLQREKLLQNQEFETNNIARCPRCGSTSIALESHKKGYGLIKGLTGAAIAGPMGLVAGALGSNKVKTKRICLKCNYKF